MRFIKLNDSTPFLKLNYKGGKKYTYNGYKVFEISYRNNKISNKLPKSIIGAFFIKLKLKMVKHEF